MKIEFLTSFTYPYGTFFPPFFFKLPTSEHFYHQAAVQVCCFGAFLCSLSNRVCVHLVH